MFYIVCNSMLMKLNAYRGPCTYICCVYLVEIPPLGLLPLKYWTFPPSFFSCYTPAHPPSPLHWIYIYISYFHSENIKRSYMEKQHVVFIDKDKGSNSSCWTEGVTSLSLALRQILLGTGFWISFYVDDILPFLPRSLTILCVV